MSKDNFLRVLRSLTEKVEIENHKTIDTNGLYETFVENYKLTGVLKVDNDFVDFDRFRQIYLLHKMNILDLIDLISGVSEVN